MKPHPSTPDRAHLLADAWKTAVKAEKKTDEPWAAYDAWKAFNRLAAELYPKQSATQQTSEPAQ